MESVRLVRRSPRVIEGTTMNFKIASIVMLALCSATTGYAAPFPAANSMPSPSSATASLAGHPYQQTVTNNSCTASSCSVQFPAITRARVAIEHISCDILLPSTSGTAFAMKGAVSVTATGSPTVTAFFLPASNGFNSGFAEYVANADVLLFAPTGGIPSATLNYVGGFTPPSLTCTISGYYL